MVTTAVPPVCSVYSAALWVTTIGRFHWNWFWGPRERV